MRRLILKGILSTAVIGSTLVAGLVFTGTAAAQSYPNKPISYILPFNPGGESDVSARFQQMVFKKIAGVDAVIQYMAGAGGAQAWSQLNSMHGDGYTIMGINLPHTVLQPMQKDVGYKTDDLTPVNYFHYTPDAIFVHKDSLFKTLKDLIDHAKKNPGMVTFSGSGSNSSNNLAQVRFDELAGIKTTYVPFSGTGPAVTAILGKQTVAGFNYAPSAITHGDKMRMLAVAAEKRMPAFPDVPTFRELGFDLVGGAYRGLSVPNTTPEDIRQKVSDIISKINAEPEFKKKMEDGGFVLTDITYKDMPKFMAEKKKEYGALAEKLGIKKQ
ncbi:MAG: tripartite tricarboxylate transporter substrate binding protein [Gammaproteobacteria bacterium]|nr:tripartite tricarboxylate transporter substrate binding protein [Rhodocyclaceae bacterium]MBU3907722.1 tripartite tricarboxylate transporter substrate binding protein [Gammaproteobacteria bacterium]MBU4004368.1 tripartite tricarboxylate transporter substrate binding protein [Gammaproteobacteria bacterium]MBU4019777.1 tripartite tricarboxylate transporter substrate binding protein [Gammaproteobacteria bacterium]MBU4097396.1 tripartite tricarboxylate transporter substrate binding protein [Gamm